MTEEPAKNSSIQWQTGPEDGVPEPAILIEAYIDVIALQQEGETIKINYKSVDELCKNLKAYAKLSKEGKLK